MGGIRQAINNYTEINDSIIVPDWFWEPYQGIVEDNNRKIATFRFFENQSFDLESFKQKIEDVGKKQENVFIILNTPANNPTGYSVTMEEWDKIISHLNSIDKKTILFLDMAYMDFAPREEKQVFQKLAHLEAHVFAIIAYTISKSLTKYGLRTAALIGLHKDKAILKEFENIIAISNRGNYGSVNSVGQLLVKELYKNKALLNDYYNELDHWKTLLNKRAEAFMNHINKEIITPYKNGFFVSIICSNPLELTEKLKNENIFLVPLEKGVRVALCSMEEDDLVTTAETLNKMPL
jgi:aromatic-amino-acid transaminase